jgi:hypothetical protein
LSPSANRQLQHAGVEAEFPFSEHSLCRWPPPHHKHRGGGGLLAVCPNVAELLTVVALRKAGLSVVGLNLDGNVAKAVQLEKFLGSRCSG